MSTRRKMIDATVRHQVFLQRYASNTTKQLLAYIKKLEQSILSNLSPRDTVLTKARYVKLIKAFKELSSSLSKANNKKIKNDLTALLQYEAEFTKRILDQSVNIDKVPFETVLPTKEQLTTAAFGNTMVSKVPLGLTGGITVAEALDTFGAKIAGNIVSKIKEGYVTGQTTQVISKSIQDYVGENLIKSQAQALARTITNHLASTAKLEFYKQNDAIIESYQIVAVLDSRTTLICASLDGKVFPKNEFRAPPYHWNCRTTYIGVVMKKYAISFPDSTRPAKGADGIQSTPGGSTYNSWLRAQPSSFQDEVLGPTRGQLFRSGMSVDKFVDENHVPYTLDELKAKDTEHN